ncbi:AMP-binding protein [Tessaracoccus sp. Y1736]
MEQWIDAVRHLLDDGEGLWLADGAGTAPAGHAVVGTSGSTGQAKHVLLSREALAAAADAAHGRLGFRATWHLTLSPRYVAGLMVLVRGLRGDGVRVGDPTLAGLAPVAGRNAVSIVATQLYRALEAPALAATLARFDAVLVGGSALSTQLRARAEAVGIRVIETYGMSETCGGVVWDGVPLPGVGVRLGPEGRVSVAGPTLFSGYLGEPGLTSETLRDGAVLTRDRGRWVDGRLHIDGRIDDVVISGGVNVDLAQVRAAARGLDADTEVLAVPDHEWGVRLVLFARHGGLDQWRERLRPALPAAALPRQLVLVDALPRTAGGKPDREKLLELLRS